VAAEPGDDGTRYRLLETMRQYAADRLAETGDADAARRRHALAFLSLAERERRAAVLSPDSDNFRAALQWALSAGDEAGPRLAYALGDFWLGRGLLAEARDWLARSLAQRPADHRLWAGLLRWLGVVLYEGGDLPGAQAVLLDGSEVAAAAGAVALQARIRVLLADIRNMQGGGNAEALGRNSRWPKARSRPVRWRWPSETRPRPSGTCGRAMRHCAPWGIGDTSPTSPACSPRRCMHKAASMRRSR